MYCIAAAILVISLQRIWINIEQNTNVQSSDSEAMDLSQKKKKKLQKEWNTMLLIEDTIFIYLLSKFILM